MARFFGVGIAGAVVVASVLISITTACDEKTSEPGGGPGGEAGPPAKPAELTPLKATFVEAMFTTKYEAAFKNPDEDELSFDWTGPNCGPFTIAGEKTCKAKDCTSEMSWQHPHPPCSEQPSHDDAVIFFKVDGKRSGKSVLCAYRGAATGTGKDCGQIGFGSSELGVFQPNYAEIIYRAGNNRCTTMQLVQVMVIKTKGPPDTIDIPHTNGMEGDDLPPYYRKPAVEDGKDGWVVDKHAEIAKSNDPFYGGAKPGSASEPATLDDRPGNTKRGHRAYFEDCAFCTAKPGDADYGKYLDCVTWTYDVDEGARLQDPQPAQKPTPGFMGAVQQWNTNHGYKMPGTP